MTRVAALLALLSIAAPAAAQNPACEDLSGRQRQAAEEILATEYLYDCCDDTISRCLEAQPTCRLALRLAEDVCRRVADGQDETGIRRALSRRARAMIGGGTPAEIDLSNAPDFGATDAPVTVAIYACGRCPYCSKLIPALYRAVDSGDLRGRARLAYRLFPIRGHEGSTEAALAFAAAADLGSFWPFMLHAYRYFDEYTPALLPTWAAAAGLDREAFTARVSDPATRESVIASKKEGLVNQVEETPTLFINGRRWVGDLTIEALVDAIAEEAERVGGDQWVTD